MEWNGMEWNGMEWKKEYGSGLTTNGSDIDSIQWRMEAPWNGWNGRNKRKVDTRPNVTKLKLLDATKPACYGGKTNWTLMR